ncbi:MAG TPA: hypothetical protein PLE81_07675 [Brevundimonas sp.]|jgi:hypothetical protein|uniref:hypothetical protein n=1 Tax=Brevundimonas sp. TaxID=1871086 RepID=UPI002BA79C38|nr:hypothetical protein [Brevundimonas sp.]HRH20504.1 hypothetical protein [Brevundimonas sp.]
MKRRSVLAGLIAVIGATVLPRPVQAQTLPEVLAFHYGWYGPDEGWGVSADGGRNHPNMPVGGRYDSLDPAVIARQIAQARAAGITGFITSWDGRDNRRDRVFEALLAAAPPGFSITAYVESSGGSAQALADRLAHLQARLSASPRALRLAGRPCLFVFDRVLQEIGEAGWAQARPRDLAVVGPANTEAEILARRPLFDGLHVYSMQFQTDGWWVGFEYQARRWLSRWVGWQRGQAVTTATILPGYDDRRLDNRTGDRPTTPRRGGRTFQMMLRAARAARPDWLLIVSWNEWFEATEIEPSMENGGRELEMAE